MSNLWDHQVKAIRAAEVNRDLGLLFEQGTGKTRTMIEILRRRFAAVGRVRKTIIFAPIIVCENWKREFKAYSKVDQRDILVLTEGGPKRIRKFLDGVGKDLTGNKIIVTNYEATQMEELFKLFMLWNPEILVCDESQRVKNHASKRAKRVVQLADLTAHNYILSGTPILNSAMDVFMQFRVLDRGQLFGKNFHSFKNIYFFDDNSGFKGKQSYYPDWQPRPTTYGELQKKISTKALRVLKKDCLDLPPLIRQEVHVGLSVEQTRAYKEMMNEYVTFIDTAQGPAAVVAQMAVTKALRLQQIVSGFAKDDQGNVHRLPCPRLAELEELLTNITPTSKVIVWAHFKENYMMIAELCDKLKVGYREIHGAIDHKTREVNMRDFRTEPDVRVMIANQAAGGVGINLVEAAYSVYYSKGFKLEDDLQSEARNHRGGSEMHDKVTRIDLVAMGTIDELVNEALSKKQTISDNILNWTDKMKL